MAILLLVFAGIFSIIIFGLTGGHAHISNIQLQTDNNFPVSVSAVFTAMLAAFWAYQGWASVGYVGGEIKNVNRTLPRGIAIGILMVIAVYLLVNATYLTLLSTEQLDAIYKSGNKIAAVEAVRSFWGQNGVLFISMLILVTTLGCCRDSATRGIASNRIATDTRLVLVTANNCLILLAIQDRFGLRLDMTLNY